MKFRIISDEPFVDLFLVFINIWNVVVAILIILPGYFLREFSEKLKKIKAHNHGSALDSQDRAAFEDVGFLTVFAYGRPSAEALAATDSRRRDDNARFSVEVENEEDLRLVQKKTGQTRIANKF